MENRAALLIVDDERGPTESLRMVFKSEFEVFTAPGGVEALEILHAQPIDVVTLDMRMPGMPGVEVMEHIKRHDPDIEIIVVTGYASLDTAVCGLRNQVFDYVTKPFDVAKISTVVHRALERRREALRAHRMKDDFLGNISHELRTPLSAIIGYNSILTEELHADLNEDQRAAFERIRSNSHDLLNLVETVLLLNSLDAGQVRLTVSTFDLCDTLRRVAHQFAPAARERGLRLSVEVARIPIWVTSDEQKLERILLALIDNAVKFTPDGSIHLGARLAVDRSHVEIHVRDTGLGIPDTDIAALVAELVPIPPAAAHARGLGLGLRVASRLADFLGGSLGASGGQSGGTLFTISVPVLGEDAHALVASHA